MDQEKVETELNVEKVVKPEVSIEEYFDEYEEYYADEDELRRKRAIKHKKRNREFRNNSSSAKEYEND